MRPTCLKTSLQEAEGHIALETSRESKILERYSWYVAYMKKLIEVEPSSYEDATKHQVWRNSMQEDYVRSLQY